ncbi:hypothetical protein K435DRAFT_794598 [Dendrothele bispora CBS 962.96]|uniref:Uncharacterized protein n=1 Tax=Dendrothele bispora (strain CBS 962.96) TaxID=1314807 RepID=A0A4S8MBL7_DENBC|nr:hypothetical protein K435DRAFT_794598 [Dendrothele bispora CBS 962.96]
MCTGIHGTQEAERTRVLGEVPKKFRQLFPNPNVYLSLPGIIWKGRTTVVISRSRAQKGLDSLVGKALSKNCQTAKKEVSSMHGRVVRERRVVFDVMVQAVNRMGGKKESVELSTPNRREFNGTVLTISSIILLLATHPRPPLTPLSTPRLQYRLMAVLTNQGDREKERDSRGYGSSSRLLREIRTSIQSPKTELQDIWNELVRQEFDVEVSGDDG